MYTSIRSVSTLLSIFQSRYKHGHTHLCFSNIIKYRLSVLYTINKCVLFLTKRRSTQAVYLKLILETSCLACFVTPTYSIPTPFANGGNIFRKVGRTEEGKITRMKFSSNRYENDKNLQMKKFINKFVCVYLRHVLHLINYIIS